jgi:uncharacterized YigZ family protein
MSQQPLSFLTPEFRHMTEIVIKKSRFIGHLVPIRSEAEAEAALDEIRQVHKSATHNCYAYTVGLNVPVERFSDDGEPSGTAGRPILEVLRRKPIANALVVVTRYFGGTLLGASGLVHAYQDATIAVIDEASLLKCSLMHEMHITSSYAWYGKLEYEINRLGYSIQDKIFGTDVQFMVYVLANDRENFVKNVNEITNGQVLVDVKPAKYVGVRADGTFVPYEWPV